MVNIRVGLSDDDGASSNNSNNNMKVIVSMVIVDVVNIVAVISCISSALLSDYGTSGVDICSIVICVYTNTICTRPGWTSIDR